MKKKKKKKKLWNRVIIYLTWMNNLACLASKQHTIATTFVAQKKKNHIIYMKKILWLEKISKEVLRLSSYHNWPLLKVWFLLNIILYISLCLAPIFHHLLDTNKASLHQVSCDMAYYLPAILLFSISLLHLQKTNIVPDPTNETDRLALLKFKELIANDPHKILSSWNDSIHFCNWHGVTCSHQHQRVAALNLQGYTLHGSISPYVGNFNFLKLVNLRDNL